MKLFFLELIFLPKAILILAVASIFDFIFLLGMFISWFFIIMLILSADVTHNFIPVKYLVKDVSL